MQNCSTQEELKQYVIQCKTRLQNILQRLDWTEEGVLKNFNSNSLASSTAPKPKKICSPKIPTYPDSCVTNNSFVIDTPQLQNLLHNKQIKAPQNFRDLQANFSREQKLKIYEHVIEQTEELENNTVAKLAEGEISLSEIVAQKKREEKRKKRKFRKSKPTHIEEVRSLVDLQMQALQQFVGNQTKRKGREYTQTERSLSRDPGRIDVTREDSYKIHKRYRSQSNEKFRKYRRRSKSCSIGRSKEHKSHRSSYYEQRKRSNSKERNRSKRRDSNTDGKSHRSKETESYRNKPSETRSPNESHRRFKDYEKYHRRHRKSPQETSSRDWQTNERSRARNVDEISYRSKDSGNKQKNTSRTRSPNENIRRLKDYEKYRSRRSKSPQTSTSIDLQFNDRSSNEKSNHNRKTYDNDSKRRRRSISRDREKYYSKEGRIEKYKERDVGKSHRKRSEDRDDNKKSRHKNKKYERERSRK